MTAEQERECVKIADALWRSGRFKKQSWAEVVTYAESLYRSGVRFKD